MTQHPSPYVDVAFPIQGTEIPIHHGYPLLGALSRLVPALHERTEWGVHPVAGEYRGKGILALTEHSRIKIRMPAADVGQILGLMCQPLDIDGHACTLGTPRIHPLITAPSLRSRLVIIKGVPVEAEDFAAVIRFRLARVPGLGQDPERIEITIGPRRVLRIKGQALPGNAVALDGLDAPSSLAVQCHGIGGRRHMGAGIFVPPRRSA